ncbi:receptor-like protein 12 [Sesamum indicum]|uniref:Receptor-like protein 12 n=1 Tax=Sesamum indicum TaxID=4182 RepID=A0A6I9SJ76_SESIN|nr:receptor-like protein 12 [Sesamum indicum]
MRLTCKHEIMLLLVFLLSVSIPSRAAKLPPHSSKHLCLDDQKTSLMQLQDDILSHNSSSVSFDDNSSMKVAKWDDRTDCCLWDGVTCDTSGNVVGLNLSYSRISGHIGAIFDLRHLQRLNLARNNFQLSPIPSGFERLTNLTHLNLSYSCFSDQIPAGISRLTRLVSLDLSTIPFCELPPTFNDPDFNHIFDFEELHRLRLERPNLESVFRNLNNLTEVILDNVDLSAQGSNWSQALSVLPRLKVLSLSHCRLSGPIHSSFANLISLNFIKLEGNNLTSEVPRFLASFRDLQVLNLASTQLYGNFPRQVFLLPRLQTIDLSKNPLLTGELPEFPSHSSLRLVSLYQTNFQGKLPDSIGNLKFMTNLLLYTCNFSGLIPSSFANLTSVTEIDISYNKFSGSIPPFRDSGVPKLADLRLSFNLLTGTIDPLIFTLPSLKVLYLNDNHLSGKLEEFPAASSVLEQVYLNGNNLSEEIPRSISEIPSISFLSLAANKFTGSLKLEAFQNLDNLTSLDLSSNSLTIGTDQPDLMFPQLQELKLSKCNLTEFPTFLKKQDQLRILNLSNNQIEGYVPKWLWTSSLNELDLSQNAVDFPEEPNQGDNANSILSPLVKLAMRSCKVFRFPEFLKLLDGLWYLDLSGNNIEGQVPNWIWHSTLQYVNISHNHLNSVEEFSPNVSLNLLATLDVRGNLLQGSLPSGICSLSSLSILDASHNQLSGSIPECLGMMSNLTVLNLQGNNYQQISLDFASASSLRSLNINRNLLEGQLPRSLANCKMLEVLDLGNNKITDTFPFWLDKLPELKVLVLRNNSFYGQIHLPRRNVSLSKLGIIDLSSNQFTGDLPPEFLESLDEMQLNSKNKSATLKTIGQYEYYQDSVTIMSKGNEMVLVRILTIFISLDLSNNKFHGKIPGEIAELKSLVVLNLSQNAFDGGIPSSLGDLVQLESLDLSWNKLSGPIPQQLTSLTFLGFFNISYNNLTGHVPQGNQFNTYSSDSYIGNTGLCGLPLSTRCVPIDDPVPEPPQQGESSTKESLFDWKFAFSGYGCGIVVGVALGYTFLPDLRFSRGRVQLKRRGRRS